MTKYLVRQAYSGSVSREIEADTPEEAEEEMLDIEIELEELGGARWDDPQAQEV